MHNKLKLTAIALAATAAIGVSGQAMAVDFYGKAHVSVASLSNTTGTDGMYVASHASRFGMKGSYDLDGGMTGIFQAESQVDYKGTATDSYAKLRNTFVGVKGSFGSIKVGYHDMPFKMAISKVDPFSDTYGDYNAVVATDNRQSGVILYQNKFEAVDLALAYAPNDGGTAVTGASVGFKAGPVKLAVAYEDTGAANASTGVLAGMDFGNTNVKLAYTQDGGATTATSYVLSGKFKMGGGMAIKAQYGKNDDTNKELTAAGLTKKFGDKTEGYLLYASGDLKGNFTADASAIALGWVQKF